MKNELRRNDSEYEVEIKVSLSPCRNTTTSTRRCSRKSTTTARKVSEPRIPRGNVVVGGGGEGVAVGEGARLAADSVLWMRGRNMARKLRNIERDRFGHAAFLSPKKASFNSSFIGIQPQLSPKSRIYSREE